jgi:hypothetical protein
VSPVSGPVDCVPLAASAPLHAPEAAQAEALVELQVRFALSPLAIVVGKALMEAVGVELGL